MRGHDSIIVALLASRGPFAEPVSSIAALPDDAPDGLERRIAELFAGAASVPVATVLFAVDTVDMGVTEIARFALFIVSCSRWNC